MQSHKLSISLSKFFLFSISWCCFVVSFEVKFYWIKAQVQIASVFKKIVNSIHQDNILSSFGIVDEFLFCKWNFVEKFFQPLIIFASLLNDIINDLVDDVDITKLNSSSKSFFKLIELKKKRGLFDHRLFKVK